MSVCTFELSSARGRIRKNGTWRSSGASFIRFAMASDSPRANWACAMTSASSLCVAVCSASDELAAVLTE